LLFHSTENFLFIIKSNCKTLQLTFILKISY